MPTKKDTGRKDTARKDTAKKPTARKVTAKKPTAGKATAESPTRGRQGDLILIDSPQVGSPPREGEVLEVIEGAVNVSYRVRWADGHTSLITPMSGTARILGHH